MKKRRYDAVVFDLDGTLLDTLKDLTDSVNAVLKEYGLMQHSQEEIEGFLGNGIRRLIECSVPGGEQNPAFPNIFDSFKSYYDKHCMDATEPYPGILHLLSELNKSGCHTAIVSNKADFAVKKLCRVYFRELVSTAVGEREGCRRKPAPDSVLQALEEMGIPKERTVYVGDSEVDIQTAQNAGIACISVYWGFRSREFLVKNGADPQRMAGNVRELEALLIHG